MSDQPVASLAEIRRLMGELPDPDREAASLAATREATLTKPPGALGRLEDLTAWLSAWQGRHPPLLERPRVAVFAGNHGVAARGVSAFPAAVTVEMVKNFVAGGAAVNQLCRVADAELRVYEMALEEPTADFTEGPALSDEECAKSAAYGMMAVEPELDLICLGEMGIANTTSAAAPFRRPVRRQGGRLDRPRHRRRRGGTRSQDRRGRGRPGAPPGFLRRPARGAAPAGRARAGGDRRRGAGGPSRPHPGAARRLRQLRRGRRAPPHRRARARPLPGRPLLAEPGHRRLLEALGKRPLLDFGMRLGEASGAALAIPILKAAVACHTGMATFDEAGVSGKL